MTTQAGGGRAQGWAREDLAEHRCCRLSGEAARDLVAAAAGVQQGGGHAPGFACGAVAAWQAQRTQVAEAHEVCAGDPQQFAAPGFAVGAETDAVEREAEHRARIEACVLGKHRGDVGVVVLHADRRHPQPRRERGGDVGGVEVRVEVVGNGAHAAIRLREQRFGSRLDAAAGVGVVEVAQIGAEPRAIAFQQAGRVLEPGAERKDGQGVSVAGEPFGEADLRAWRQLASAAGRCRRHDRVAVGRPRLWIGLAAHARRADACAAARPASIHASHSSMPSPLVAELRITRSRGFTRSA